MKPPERLVGFVNYGDTKYPFEFDKESFYLNMYPPTTEIWDETSSFREFFQSFEKNDKRHKWIGELRIEGFSSDGKKVVFCLQNHRSNYHGFYSYPVNWYFYYSEQMKSDELDGFSVECEEINYFFNPQQAMESVLHFSSDRSRLEKITVQSNKQITEQCGKYRIIPHVDAQIEVTCYAVAHSNSYTNPIDATSKMVVSFSSPVSIDTVIDTYRHVTGFLQFITYRKNIVFNTVPVFVMNANGLREYASLLVFGKEPEVETHKKRKEVIIPYDVIFGYHEKEVLHGINMTIREGTVNALVGPSGSGKSTIAKLVAGLWDVDGGSISLGGVDIRQLTQEDYNRCIAYVSQDNYLFDTTVISKLF